MKKVLIIGGGISGTFLAIALKESHSDYQVSIFEHNDKLLKKIYATGNGKCNFANKGELKDKYHNEQFALPILSSFNASDIVKYFEKIGIEVKSVNDLLYPYSESAETVANKLLEQVRLLNVDVHLSEDVIDYSENKLVTSKGEYPYDYLVISTGGKSSPQLGNNGNMFSILEKHGYQLRRLNPSLCPVVTKENTKMIEGLRHKSLVSLYQKNKLIHQEEGELLFKKDGLSGMVIFNMSHYINELDNANDVKIVIDFAINKKGEADSLVHPKLAKYLLDNHLDIHHTVFTFKKFYDFPYSQVTSGGVSINDIHTDLSSKKEENIYFIGEVIDVDAVCGGYNIMWAIASAVKVSQSIK